MLLQLRQGRVHRNAQSCSRSSLRTSCMHGDDLEIQPDDLDSLAISYRKEKKQIKMINKKFATKSFKKVKNSQ